MAQIQEYTPQVAAPEGLGGVSPNTEYAGAMGRGIEELGAGVAQAAHGVHQRDVQQESADVYSHIADQRAFWTTKLQQQTQDGTLDVNKFMDDFQNSTDDFGSNLNTRESKLFFERQQARLKGSLMQTASAGAAVVAAADAKISWQTANAKDAQSITLDPSHQNFQSVYDAGLERIDQLVKTGGLPEKYRAKAVQEMGVEFSKAAVRGLSDTNPDLAKELLKKGAFSDYLNSDQTHEMKKEVDGAINAKEVEGKRFDANLIRLQKAKSEKWGAENFEKLQSASLSTKDVTAAVRSGDISWEQGERWVKLIDESAKRPYKGNPGLSNDIAQRIVNPDSPNPIRSLEDIGAQVKPGGLNIEDYNHLASVYNNSQRPEAKLENKIKTQAYSQMKASFQGANFFAGKKDPVAEEQFQAAQIDMENRLQQGVKEGKTIQNMLDPSSKDYITQSVIRAHSKTPTELMQNKLDQLQKPKTPTDGETHNDNGVIWKVVNGQWVKQ